MQVDAPYCTVLTCVLFAVGLQESELQSAVGNDTRQLAVVTTGPVRVDLCHDDARIRWILLMRRSGSVGVSVTTCW